MLNRMKVATTLSAVNGSCQTSPPPPPKALSRHLHLAILLKQPPNQCK